MLEDWDGQVWQPQGPDKLKVFNVPGGDSIIHESCCCTNFRELSLPIQLNPKSGKWSKNQAQQSYIIWVTDFSVLGPLEPWSKLCTSSEQKTMGKKLLLSLFSSIF